MQTTIKYAPDAWKLLQGVFCVYKPPDMSIPFLREVLIGNLCRDLNQLIPRPALPHIVLEGSVGDELVVRKKENYADHPLVIGPRYQPKDFKISYASHLNKNISGVCVMGVNRGTSGTHTVREGRLVRTFSLGGRFGLATDTGFHDGKVLTKATYRHITKSKLAKVLMSIQASHQQSAAHFLGLDLQSQEAYEALSEEGLVRPSEKSPPLIYNLDILDFNPPDFTLEVSCINEKHYFLQDLVHKIGLQLKSNAVCTQMRCIRNGPWTLQHALLRKHWTLEHIINNITLSQPLVEDIKPKSPSLMNIDNTNYDSSEGTAQR